ncbi:hypothetical protein SAMN03080615_04373 [Amphritea atlantica]|uniref:Uncharacterized protein n=1 Tax=Amphritea atlantica TaxID=355243 RepID=A0A1H9MBQ3_9GAMM|nr:hypothetical protein [Amphritea atlantica]SER21124.1 hypothetical protein SAMN03080615_04373 [Amphritea atlantica]
MSRSLYELCCRYSNGELETHEYRRLRRHFINHLVNRGDQTQPVSEPDGGDLTQPQQRMEEIQHSQVRDLQQQANIAAPAMHRNVLPVSSATPPNKSAGKWLAITACLLLVAGGLYWVLSRQTSQPLQAGGEIDIGSTANSVTSTPVVAQMYALLEQDKWSITDIEAYYSLLLQSSEAERSLLRSDNRYHQFLDSVHISHALAQADQNEEMIAKLTQLEQALRD